MKKSYTRLAGLIAGSAVVLQFGGCFTQDWVLALAGAGAILSGLVIFAT